MRIQKRLKAVSDELERTKQELQVAGEQLSFQTDVATDAENLKVVSETPLANRDSSEAQRDLENIRKHYERLRQRIETLRKDQDRLLDQMSERPS